MATISNKELNSIKLCMDNFGNGTFTRKMFEALRKQEPEKYCAFETMTGYNYLKIVQKERFELKGGKQTTRAKLVHIPTGEVLADVSDAYYSILIENPNIEVRQVSEPAQGVRYHYQIDYSKLLGVLRHNEHNTSYAYERQKEEMEKLTVRMYNKLANIDQTKNLIAKLEGEG